MAVSDSSSAKKDDRKAILKRPPLQAAFCLEECKRSAYMKSRDGRTMLQLSVRYAENSKALEHL
jgi:hypothetical protein